MLLLNAALAMIPIPSPFMTQVFVILASAALETIPDLSRARRKVSLRLLLPVALLTQVTQPVMFSFQSRMIWHGDPAR